MIYLPISAVDSVVPTNGLELYKGLSMTGGSWKKSPTNIIDAPPKNYDSISCRISVNL